MVEIMAARVGDAAALARVHVATWRAAYAGLLPDELLRSLSVAEPEANWVTAIGDGPAAGVATVVALAAGGLVGFASVGPARDDDLSEDVSELWSLYVHPDSWGAGVGHALHSRALLRMRERAGVERDVVGAHRQRPGEAFLRGPRVARRRHGADRLARGRAPRGEPLPAPGPDVGGTLAVPSHPAGRHPRAALA